jgi:hypothetical protein
MKKLFFFLFLLSYLTSCVVEKRVYNKGFYIHKKSTYNLQKKQGQFEEENFVNEINALPIEDTLITSTSDITGNLENSSPCDTIIFVNGDTLYGNVIILNDRWIGIDDCDSVLVKKPSFKRSAIREIHYASGEKEFIFEKIKLEKQEASEKEIKKPVVKYDEDPHPAFQVSIILLLLSVVFLLIAISSKTVALLFYGALLMCLGAIIFSVISLIIHIVNHNRKITLIAAIIEIIVLGVTFLALYYSKLNT